MRNTSFNSPEWHLMSLDFQSILPAWLPAETMLCAAVGKNKNTVSITYSSLMESSCLWMVGRLEECYGSVFKKEIEQTGRTLFSLLYFQEKKSTIISTFYARGKVHRSNRATFKIYQVCWQLFLPSNHMGRNNCKEPSRKYNQNPERLEAFLVSIFLDDENGLEKE